MVNAALVIDAGRLSSLATFLHAFFLITCIDMKELTVANNFSQI